MIAILLSSAATWYWLVGRRTIGIERSVCYDCFWKYQPPAFESALIEMYSSFPCTDDLCRAETAFLVGNVIPDKTRIVQSLQLYKSVLKNDSHPTRRMLAALALAMAGGRARIDERPYLRAAADLSYTAGRKTTGDLLMRLREGNPPPRFGDAPIRRKLSIPAGANAMVLGTSSIVVPPGAMVSVQLERTFRDWLSYQLYFDFREQSLTRERVLNYHEGARLRDLMQIIPLRPAPALATILAVRDGIWYAPDEGGTYRFRVNDDLLWYPTTKRRGHY
ncbi:MAG TPA: hypothetical protein VFL80_03240, partial [Thermoanaerobaculia bacterium]|nr:hypothetical protein [Thermoanaerobaculia bacterium]